MASFPIRIDNVDGRGIDFDEVHGHLMESFRAFLRDIEDPAATVLDVGCGTGRVALLIARHVGTVVGADRDEHALVLAAETARTNNIRNIHFYASDVNAEPWSEWAPRSVDAVVTHLSFTDTMAKRAFEALKPGGRFVVACFGPDQWRETGRQSRYIRTPEQVDAALREAGFEVEDVVVEKLVASFSHFGQIDQNFLPPGHPVRDAWTRDGRFQALKEHFEKGGVTFTESRVVARARKPGGDPPTRIR